MLFFSVRVLHGELDIASNLTHHYAEHLTLCFTSAHLDLWTSRKEKRGISVLLNH